MKSSIKLLSFFFLITCSLNVGAQENLRITSDGKFLFNTNSPMGSGDITLLSKNISGFGGMYITSPDLETGQPFYGYGIGTTFKAYHYYDQSLQSWILNNNGNHLAINRNGRMGVGTLLPDTSAILDLSSSNKGLLLPRISNKNNINQPAEGLLIYDSFDKSVYIRDNNAWKTVGGGGGLWTENAFFGGIQYSSGRVSIGITPDFNSSLRIATGASNTNGILSLANTSSAAVKSGVIGEASSAGTGDRHGVRGSAFAPSSGSAETYGVKGSAAQGSAVGRAFGVYGEVSGSGSGERWAGYFDGKTKSVNDLEVGDKLMLQPVGFQSGAEIEMYDNDGTKTISIRANESTNQGGEIIMTEENGNTTVQIDAQSGLSNGGFLGLYDEDGDTRFELTAQEANDDAAVLRMHNSDDVRTITIDAEEFNGQGAAIAMFNSTSLKTIELDADVNGKGRVITDELEIKGGSDLAEMFDISASTILHSIVSPTPGMVVSIDPESPGKLKLTDEPMDKKIVGVISGANGILPGMMMGQKGTVAFGDFPVAMAGRVYVKADDSNGVIAPGDFLTSSKNSGWAAKVIDLDKANGAILGKAMTAKDEKGFVLLLVNLK